MRFSRLIRHSERFLNISQHEWSRVIPAFLIKLFFQIAAITGSTIVMALFLDSYAIERLPVLFIIQALLIIFGTSVLSGILRRIPPSHMIIGGCSIAAIGVFVSGFFFADKPAIFFAIVLVSLSVFVAQVSIWISLFIENLFSPLEGERAFPVIESSEPIGGILGGLLIILLIDHINAVQMLSVVALSLAAIPPVLMFSLKRLNSIPVLKVRRENRIQKRAVRSIISNTHKFLGKNRYLAGLFLVVFLQYSAVHLLEYQYSRAIDEHVRESESYAYGPHQADSQVHAEELSRDFGYIHIGIHTLLLLLQLLVASKILQRIGVIRTFAIGPIVSGLSFMAMFVRLDFFTAVFAKGVYDVSGGLSKNAFLHTFYALPENFRDEAKEMLEGVARPLGLLFGTISLLILQQLMSFNALPVAITVMLVVGSLLATLLLFKLRSYYSQVSREKFKEKENLPEKMNAIEILSQPGHHNAINFLIESLLASDEIPEVKIKVLQVIGRMQKGAAIPVLISCFKDENPKVRFAAVEALGCYENLGERFFKEAFSRYAVQSSLKELFLNTRSTSLKIAAMKVFANMRDPEIIPFLLDMLQSKDPEVRSECISVFGLFHDAGTITPLLPCLEDRDAKVRSSTIISLWQYESIRPQLRLIMQNMLNSSNIEELVRGIFCAGETHNRQQREKLLSLLEHHNHRIRRHAAIALAKMNENNVTDHLVTYLFHHEKEVGIKTKHLLRGVNHKILQRVENRCVQEVAQRVTRILEKAGTAILENLPVKDLHELQHLFRLINAEQEMWKIRMILIEKGELEPIRA